MMKEKGIWSIPISCRAVAEVDVVGVVDRNSFRVVFDSLVKVLAGEGAVAFSFEFFCSRVRHLLCLRNGKKKEHKKNGKNIF